MITFTLFISDANALLFLENTEKMFHGLIYPNLHYIALSVVKQLNVVNI